MAFTGWQILKSLLIKQEGTLTPKAIEIVPGGTANTTTTLTSSQTVDSTLTLPDAVTDTLVGRQTSDVLTNKTINADLNTITNIENADIKAGAAIDATKIANGTVDNTEFQYLNGVTSSIQTQLNTNATGLSDHLSDPTAAHAASAVSFDPTGSSLVATDVQAAIIENDSNLTDHLNDTTVHGTTSAVVGISDSQTLTNKTIEVNDNTIGSTGAPLGHVLTADGVGGSAWAAGGSGSVDSSFEISNLTLETSVAANALTIAVKTKAGTDPTALDPVYVGMRSSTNSSGLYFRRSITSALSMVVSAGSTLGHVSGVNSAQNIYVYLIDNAGTLELAVSGTLYPDAAVISTASEGGVGGADNRETIYSSTARTNVPSRLVGTLVSGQTTAGQWAVVPNQAIVTPLFGPVTKIRTVVLNGGTSGTYTPSPYTKFIRVRMNGGGGGGGGGRANGVGGADGTNGTATTFSGGGGTFTCNGGSRGLGGANATLNGGGNGGTVSVVGPSPFSVTANRFGRRGEDQRFIGSIANAAIDGGRGGFVAYSFGCGGDGGRSSTAGVATTLGSGAGGGSGGECEGWIYNPNFSGYAYSVGVGGTGGAGGGLGADAGEDGESGVIVIEEFI